VRKIPKDLDFFDLMGWAALVAAVITAPARAIRRLRGREEW
jgi:hypothetical protein